MDDAALLLALDSCEYLFLTGIGEPEANCPRLVIEEGQVTGELAQWTSAMDVRSRACAR